MHLDFLMRNTCSILELRCFGNPFCIGLINILDIMVSPSSQRTFRLSMAVTALLMMATSDA